MTQPNSELQLAIAASIAAGKAILDIYYKPDFESELKNDNSPLTEADLAASKIINNYLTDTPYPIINEEIKNKGYAERQMWETCWIVDPLDGTKEFIKRNGEFTVNIALCKNGMPVLGVIYVPVSRELYYSDVTSHSAFKSILDEGHKLKSEILNEDDLIFPAKPNNKLISVFVISYNMNYNKL